MILEIFPHHWYLSVYCCFVLCGPQFYFIRQNLKLSHHKEKIFFLFFFFFFIVSMKRWMLAELMWSSFHTMYKWNHHAVPSSFYGDVNYFSIKLEKIEIETRNFLMNISKQGHYVTGTGTSAASPRLGPPPFFQAQGFPSSL